MDSDAVFEAGNPATRALLIFKGRELVFSYGESRCVNCGKPFPFRWLTNTEYETPSRCVQCHDAAVEAAHAESLAKEFAAVQRERRTRGVPFGYSENDTSRFPVVWEAIKHWDPSDGRGLGLIGPTGLCKTRMVYQRLMDLREEKKIRFMAMTSFRLQQAIQHQWSDDSFKEVIRKARKAPVLFLDDLGKQKFTEGSEPELFDIIEDRTSNRLPIVFTSNHPGKTIGAMMGNNVSGPFLRRLREFCDTHVAI